jgi:hypothetical protein
MVNANVLKLFGFANAEAEEQQADAEALEWAEMPFVLRLADGEFAAWSPPVVNIEGACDKGAERIAATQRSIGESYGLQLIAHMLRHGAAAETRFGEVLEAMHGRATWSNIERGFLGVVGGYIASNDRPFFSGAAARIQAARMS